MLRHLLPAALALASASASAELVTVRYDFPDRANYAMTWGFFGGELGPVTGHIVSTTLHIDYTTSGDQDAADIQAYLASIPQPAALKDIPLLAP